MDKALIRRQILQQRNELNNNQLSVYSKGLAKQLTSHNVFSAANNIASYLSVGKEMPTDTIHTDLKKSNKRLFVPKIIAGELKEMLFCEVTENTVYKNGSFGIREPSNTHTSKPAKQMDLILLPLVAFDKKGNRLGMGGGYYDRTLSFCKNKDQGLKPILLGLAYGFQLVETLPTEPWDVPLDGIVTNTQLLLF